MKRSPKPFLIIALVVSLSACSSSPEITTPPTSSKSPSSEVPASSVTQSTTPDSTAKVAIPGVQSSGEIIFKQPPKGSPSGYFDTVNNSPNLEHTIPKTIPFKVSGWAVYPDYSKPADLVIITVNEDSTPIAAVPVTLERPDIVKAFKKSALGKSGWSANIDPSFLSGDKVTIKAWAYHPNTKEAILLYNVHEIVLK